MLALPLSYLNALGSFNFLACMYLLFFMYYQYKRDQAGPKSIKLKMSVTELETTQLFNLYSDV